MADILRFKLLLVFALVLSSCSPVTPPGDADIIVVGAGIAGLSAALEASAQGASVLVIDANSVGGGHAVKAGGFALVNTQLQRDKGIEDSPNLAWLDLSRWGETPDPFWSRRYTEESATEVYDWLTSMGVNFTVILPTPDHSVPRFHFTSGTAVNAVIPMLRKALLDPNINFFWNTRALALTRHDGRISGVITENTRTNERVNLRTPAVILATGGFQNNLDMVRTHWPDDSAPEKIYKGAAQFATGDGYRMAEWAGAEMQRMSDQVTFFTGVPDPRDPTGERAFNARNPAAIWLDNQGRRFVNESGGDKNLDKAARDLKPVSFWMLFDERGSRKFNIRSMPWMNRDTIRTEFLENPDITLQADSLEELADAMNISAHNLRATVQIWNRMLDVGSDFQFDRFNGAKRPAGLRPVKTAPFYAVRAYPMTRKSLGGPAINTRGQVTDTQRESIPGLYAAGELTGVAGINGRYGGSGTFLGPAVLTGRVAGREAALESDKSTTLKPSKFSIPAGTERSPGQPGYWHFDAVHSTVSERGDQCARCHSEQMPMKNATERVHMITMLGTCTSCH